MVNDLAGREAQLSRVQERGHVVWGCDHAVVAAVCRGVCDSRRTPFLLLRHSTMEFYVRRCSGEMSARVAEQRPSCINLLTSVAQVVRHAIAPIMTMCEQ